MPRSTMWHDGVKITASSRGGGLGALLALLVMLAAAVGAVYVLVAVAVDVSAVLDVAVPSVVVFALVAAGVRHAVAEARVTRLAAQTERRYQARQEALAREAVQVAPAPEAPLRVEAERVEALPAPAPRADLPWDREPVELEGRWSA